MADGEEVAPEADSEEPISLDGGVGGGCGGGEAAAVTDAVKKKKKVVVVLGATGAGKSRLAIDLASHFSNVDVVNADSMQVYRGLDVLTNKVPVPDRNGVPHHLLGCIDPSVEFTSRDFRDHAIPVIDDILSRNGLPVLVGGTNYYIQALASPFLVDDIVENLESCSLDGPRELVGFYAIASFERLKEVDPVAANRIHPNDQRKINRYMTCTKAQVSAKVIFSKGGMKWGRADSFRYNCCFIWVDVSLPVLDKYVEQRVDCMLDTGLLNEVHDIYNPSVDFTRGLCQAIGVREFETFFKNYFSHEDSAETPRPGFSEILQQNDGELKILLTEAIDKLKANTRKLVRRQKRRLNQLKAYFGWDMHHIDATEAFSCNSCDIWQTTVVEPCVDIVRGFLLEESSPTGKAELGYFKSKNMASRDLWTQYTCEESSSTGKTELGYFKSKNMASRDLRTQYTCEACGNQVLRGAHEWEQHKQGRGHRKRTLRLKKCLDRPTKMEQSSSGPSQEIQSPI